MRIAGRTVQRISKSIQIGPGGLIGSKGAGGGGAATAVIAPGVATTPLTLPQSNPVARYRPVPVSGPHQFDQSCVGIRARRYLAAPAHPARRRSDAASAPIAPDRACVRRRVVGIGWRACG